MDSVKVTLQDNILPYLQVINDGDDLADKANFSIVIGLFAAKMITLEKAAELAGKSIWNFIDTLKETSIKCQKRTSDSLGRIYGRGYADGCSCIKETCGGHVWLK